MTAALRIALLGAGLLAIGLAPQPIVQAAAPVDQAPPDGGAAQFDGRTRVGVELFERKGAEPGPRAARNDENLAEDPDDEEAGGGASPEPSSVAGSRDNRWTAADVLYMRDRATPRARCIIDREVGGFGYDPWRRGSQGERGPVQLHPRGLLPEYLTWSGGQAPENPYWAVPYLEYKLRQGQGGQWSPVRLGLC